MSYIYLFIYCLFQWMELMQHSTSWGLL